VSVFNVLLAGVGGQGIVFTSRILLEEAVLRQCPARGAETHGMAQRGGSVVAHARFGPCHSPLVIPGTGHLLLALEPREGLRSLPLLRDGGTFLVNTPGLDFIDQDSSAELSTYLDDHRIVVLPLDAAKIAAELGNPMAVNLILTGFAAALPQTPFTLEGLRDAVPRVARSHHEAMIAALEAGHRAGMREPA